MKGTVAMLSLGQKLRKTIRTEGLAPRDSAWNPVDRASQAVRVYPRPASTNPQDPRIRRGGRTGCARFWPNCSHNEDIPGVMRLFLGIDQQTMGFSIREREMEIPVLVGSRQIPWEGPAICELNHQGTRIYSGLDEMPQFLSLITRYRRRD